MLFLEDLEWHIYDKNEGIYAMYLTLEDEGGQGYNFSLHINKDVCTLDGIEIEKIKEVTGGK